MTVSTAPGFAISLLCAVALFVCLFSNINKNRLWGLTMWGSAAAYGITGFLFLLNPYTLVELYPVPCFLLTTLLMLLVVAYSYVKSANKLYELATAVERLAMLESRQRAFRTLGVGTGWIVIVTGLIVMYGVAEQTMPLDFGKQLARIERNQNVNEQKAEQRYAELLKKGENRDKRLDKLESTDRLKAAHDNVLFDKLAAGQRYIVTLFRASKARADRPLLITVPQPRSLPRGNFNPPAAETVRPVSPINKRGKKLSQAPTIVAADTLDLAQLLPLHLPY